MVFLFEDDINEFTTSDLYFTAVTSSLSYSVLLKLLLLLSFCYFIKLGTIVYDARSVFTSFSNLLITWAAKEIPALELYGGLSSLIGGISLGLFFSK